MSIRVTTAPQIHEAEAANCLHDGNYSEVTNHLLSIAKKVDPISQKNLLDHFGSTFASLLLVVAAFFLHCPTLRQHKLYAQSLPFGALIKAIGDGSPMCAFFGTSGN